MKFVADLNDEQARKYVDGGGERCPLCDYHALNVVGGPSSDGNDSISLAVSCVACGRHFVESYLLSTVSASEHCCPRCGEIIKDGEDVTKAGEDFYHAHARCSPVAVGQGLRCFCPACGVQIPLTDAPGGAEGTCPGCLGDVAAAEVDDQTGRWSYTVTPAQEDEEDEEAG